VSELFADDYPTRTDGRCGMSWIIPVALTVLGLVVLVVAFRYWGPTDRL
jgi:cytochrome c-type biogenesis protein CcmH/NrfF